MNPRIRLLPVLLFVAPQVQSQALAQERGALLERVSEVLAKSYYDEDLRAGIPAIAEGYAAGCTDYLTKPINEKVLAQKMKDLIG